MLRLAIDDSVQRLQFSIAGIYRLYITPGTIRQTFFDSLENPVKPR
jgi:hypothetical protein